MPNNNTANRNTPKGVRPRSLIEYRVSGLRDYEEPSEVKVFSALTGAFLRVEQPSDFQQARFNNRRNKV